MKKVIASLQAFCDDCVWGKALLISHGHMDTAVQVPSPIKSQFLFPWQQSYPIHGNDLFSNI